MQRIFSEHRIRPVESLDGLWDFTPAPGREPLPSAIPAAGRIVVPSCWEMCPGWESWRGQARLSRTLSTQQDRGVRLVFGGVSHTADVYLDGQHLAHHYDAFTPFEAIHWPDSRGTCTLEVQVDNTLGDHSALHLSNDYYTYGGITRPVTVEYIPRVYLAHMRATPMAQADGKWNLDVMVTVASHGEGHAAQECVLHLAGKPVWRSRVTPSADGTTSLHAVIPAAGVATWSPAQPNLYELAAELHDAAGTVTDDLIDRVGFREVRVDGDRILLNGSPIRLWGYNRHEDHQFFGSALPLQAIAHDLALLRDLGANFVRTSHYPNDLRFLDLCDETGMLVWEESHARQVKFNHPRFTEQITTSTREMLHWHHNHPSIILWGCLNECDTETDDGIHHHEAVIKIIKDTDRSRPVTYAGHRQKKDRCTGLVDVVSHNLYTGWYHGTPDDITSHLDDYLQWLDSPQSGGGAGKPVIISEFGAGAITGFRAPPLLHLTEDYQVLVLQKAIQAYGRHSRLSGLCIWQFADCRVSEEGNWWISRPRNMNDKGTVGRDRRPKWVYATVKQEFDGLKQAAARRA